MLSSSTNSARNVHSLAGTNTRASSLTRCVAPPCWLTRLICTGTLTVLAGLPSTEITRVRLVRRAAMADQECADNVLGVIIHDVLHLDRAGTQPPDTHAAGEDAG